MQTLNKTIHPKGGYVFMDKDRTTFRASSWDLLVSSVTSYRVRNRFPVGNPLEEITQQACRRDPNACRDSAQAPSAVTPMSLRSKTLLWLTKLRRVKQTEGPLRQVSREEAVRRAAICRACPRQKTIPSGCSACGDALTALRGVVLGKPAPVQGIDACEVLAVDLVVATSLEEAAVVDANLPKECWRKVNENP